MANQGGWHGARGADMSLMDHLTAFFEPFLPRHAPTDDDAERRRRQVEQSRQSEALLRQLRAELKLMRLWKQSPEREEPPC